jgi:lysophospholipase L1-like esterase
MRRWCAGLALAVGVATAATGAEAPLAESVKLVGTLQNSRLQFERARRGTVAFLGGSITEMEGFRPRVSALLRARFPETAFSFINAGIASTCSNTGAFRLDQDVLAHGPVDLLVVEFAVNDDQDGGFTRTECIRGLEGIVRHARAANPLTDIVVAYFVNDAFLKSYQGGEIPLAIAAHAAVAEHYHLSTVNVAQALTTAIGRGEMTWKRYGGVHPGPDGADFCAHLFGRLFAQAWDEPLPPGAKAFAEPMPAIPLDPFSYAHGQLISPEWTRMRREWTWGVPDWKALPGGKRSRFTSIPLLSATEPGAELTFAFLGTAVGAYVVSGPDAGMVDVRIDGGPPRRIALKTGHSGALHYPWTVMFGSELSPGEHELRLRLAEETQGSGHAMRIIQFAVNGP